MDEQKERFYEFDDYRIETVERVLRRGEVVISLQPKAVELLLVLLENHGRVVSKEDLLARVWENQFVEEANLSHTVFQLRKTLGGKNGKFIETIPKRGYRFAADVRKTFDDQTKILVGEQTVTRISVEEEIDTFQIPNSKFQTGSQNLNLKKSTVFFSIALLFAAGAALGGIVYFSRENKTSAQKFAPRFTRLTNSDKMIASTISPDGKFIAYAQNYTSGEGTLYIRQIETNREVRLLEPRESFFGTTAFSPDGAFIYYIEHKRNAAQGVLNRISIFGGQPSKILDDVNYMFGLAPDGERVAFFRNEPEEKQRSLIIATLDGSSEQEILTRPNDKLHIDLCPAWSPDGRLIAFGATEKNDSEQTKNQPPMHIFILEIATGEVKKLSREAWLGVGKMNWMPDGSGVVFLGNLPRIGVHIYFVSYPQGESKRLTNELNNFGNYGLGITADGTTMVADLWERSFQLWTTDIASNNNAEQITFGTKDGERGIASLPDGSIIYIARSGETTDLWKTGAGKTEPLTTDDFTEFGISAAPDGSFLVFSSNRSGGAHLFRMELSDLSVRQLTFGDSFDDAPEISPDGNWIIYNAGETLWKMPGAGGEAVQLTDYKALVPAFSPDGTQISAILPADKITENATLAIISGDGGGKPLKTFPVIPFWWYYRAARWTADGKAVTFRKTEKSITNLWKQDLAGGEPTPLTDFKSEFISNYIFSRDGKRLIAARGHFGDGVAMIKNFQ